MESFEPHRVDGPDSVSDDQVRRAAQIEANTRRVNEAIEAGGDLDRLVFVCECGKLNCGITIDLSREEYEAVRTSFDRLVSKRDPEARDLVEAADPRCEG